MAYPDLGDWHGLKPVDDQASAVLIAERLAWLAIDQLTAGRVAIEPVVVRPQTVEDDGSVLLPPPVGGVVRVRIDGLTLTTSKYRIDDDRRLVRLDGGSWPTGQDMNLTSGDGVFEVTYWQGYRPGPLLVWAAQELAGEFYAAATGKKCRLPKNVTAVTRQGVSFQMSAPLFTKGRTGIHEIDVVLAGYNPRGVSSPAVIASPDTIARAPRRVL